MALDHRILARGFRGPLEVVGSPASLKTISDGGPRARTIGAGRPHRRHLVRGFVIRCGRVACDRQRQRPADTKRGHFHIRRADSASQWLVIEESLGEAQVRRRGVRSGGLLRKQRFEFFVGQRFFFQESLRTTLES